MEPTPLAVSAAAVAAATIAVFSAVAAPAVVVVPGLGTCLRW